MATVHRNKTFIYVIHETIKFYGESMLPADNKLRQHH